MLIVRGESCAGDLFQVPTSSELNTITLTAIAQEKQVNDEWR